MKIGLIYPQTELGGDPVAVREIGLAAEALGFDHLLAYDHVLGATHDREPKLNGPYTEKQPFHDPLVMFGYLSAITRRIGFATGVLILPQRQTALVARQAADVALLSDDRLRLGVGLGWNYVEYEALRQDFASRGKRVSEQVSAAAAACGPGTYQASTGQADCDPCPAGQYSTGTGATECVACGAGSKTGVSGTGASHWLAEE